MFRSLFLSASLLCLSPLTALANGGELLPRVEAGGKLGTERSLGTGEMWVPLSQGPDRVLYGDIRFMADDRENNEGNVGLGYRQIVDAPFAGEVIAGGHVWADRRRSESDHVFTQTAAGVELLARDWDIRANAYLPLSGDKTRSVSQENGQSSDPYLAGSGIYYDTGGRTVTTMTEEPQPGFDLELGARVPVFEDHVDAVRVYGSGYHFIGDKTEDVSGWRARVVADITPSFSIGGRFQRDDERGSQGFLEATLRFPFEAKKSFREESLRARLDESPERDVDIVTGAKVTRREIYGQKGVAVLASATGDAQRVLHVDNTAGAGGDGSKDRPFNTLKAAEAAMQAYDVIYVRAGDGTTTGQDEGIVIDKAGVSLIGSGTNFVYDGAKFTAASGKDYTGTLLAAATTAPVITNTEASVDNYTGSGVLVTESNALISGMKITGATSNGIKIIADNETIKNIVIRDNTAKLNILNGFYVHAVNEGNIDDVTVSSNYAYQNGDGTYGLGFEFQAEGIGSLIKSIEADNNQSEYNSEHGMRVRTTSAGTIDRVHVYKNIFNNNLRNGFVMRLEDEDTIHSAVVEKNEAYLNGQNGLYVTILNTGTIENIKFANNYSYDNSSGIIIQAQNSGIIENAIVSSNILNNNVNYGANFAANSSSALNVMMETNVITDNEYDGVRINDDTAGIFNVDLGGGIFGSLGNNSIHGNGTRNPAIYRDMRLDLDGSEVAAQGNWWGQAGGPLPGQIVSEGACPNCGTADTSNPLDEGQSL